MFKKAINVLFRPWGMFTMESFLVYQLNPTPQYYSASVYNPKKSHDK